MSNSTESKSQRRLNSLSLRARLVIGVMVIVGLSLLVLTYFTFQRQRELTDFITTLVNREVRQQAESLLTETVSHSSENANAFFDDVINDVEIVSSYTTVLYNSQLQTNDYWQAEEELTRLAENQWGNTTADPGSILAPSFFELTAETAAEINTTILLNLIVPQIIGANPDLKALYFINDAGVTHYYPNIDLANIVGDFDARQRPYYKAVVPEINPDRDPFWTAPYYDATDSSLVETYSLPIYNEAGDFKGVVAADVNINTVAELVNNLKLGETGFAFLIDPNGRFLVLPEAALENFGFGSEALPEDDIPQITIFDADADISAFADQMISGETGLGTFTREGADYYFAYAPIEAAGYSLGLVVPVAEMTQLYLTVQDNVIAEENTTLQIIILLFVVVLIAALIFAYVIGLIITRPLQQLTKAAEEVSAGHYDIEINTNLGGEAGTLAIAFDDMTHQIQDLVGSLEQRVAERTRALEASMEVSRSVSTILDQQQLVAEVVTQVQAAFDYYHVHIYVIDDITKELLIAGGTGEAGQALLIGQHKIAPGKGLVGRAADTRRTVLVANVVEEKGWLPNPLLPDTKAEIAVPILMGNQVLGVLDVQQNVAGSLTEIDAQLLESVANQVGIALRNARLYESAQTLARREAVANTINQKLQTAADIESVLQIAAQELGKALNSQRATVQLGKAELANANQGDENRPHDENGRHAASIA